PSKTGKWGWRVEGHHLALNFTLDGSQIVSATPAFFGANPATVKDGPRKGLRTLAEAEDLARELFQSLDDSQKKVAYQDTPSREAPAPGVTESAPGDSRTPGDDASRLAGRNHEAIRRHPSLSPGPQGPRSAARPSIGRVQSTCAVEHPQGRAEHERN